MQTLQYSCFSSKISEKTLSFFTLCKCPYIVNGIISMINMDSELLVDLMPVQFRPLSNEL